MGVSVSVVNPSIIAREGLCRIISDSGIHIAASAQSVTELTHRGTPCGDLILLDLAHWDDQIQSLEHLRDAPGDLKSLVLTDKFELSAMMSCFALGAQGYAVKDIPCSTLIAIMNLAVLGHKVMPSDAVELFRQDAMPLDRMPASKSTVGEANLSQREHDVLCCLMAGYPNKLIARQLEVSEATVKVHVKAILRKLNVMNRTQAALWATSHGIGNGAEFDTP